MSTCNARQEGDEMACGRCGLRWEVADPNPPACLQHERRSRPRGPMADGARALQLAGVEPHPIQSAAAVAQPPQQYAVTRAADSADALRYLTAAPGSFVPMRPGAELPIALPPPPGELDVEAVAWAYQKLMAFGVGAVNEDSAMMMDRLNLMLLGS